MVAQGDAVRCALRGLCGLWLLACFNTRPARAQAELPLKSVLLFSDGIVVVERAGQLSDDVLRFWIKARDAQGVFMSLAVWQQVDQRLHALKPAATLAPQEAEAPQARTAYAVRFHERPAAPLLVRYALRTDPIQLEYRAQLSSVHAPTDAARIEAWASIANDSSEDWPSISVRLGDRAPSGLYFWVARPACAMPYLGRQAGLLERVWFARNQAQVLPVSYPVLDEVARILRLRPELEHIALEGHATPDERLPWTLSTKRTLSIASYLREHGVSTPLHIVPYGTLRPRHPHTDRDLREANRRVELVSVELAPGQQSFRAGAPLGDVDVRYALPEPVTLAQGGRATLRASADVGLIEDVLVFAQPAKPGPSIVAAPHHAIRIWARQELQAAPLFLHRPGAIAQRLELTHLRANESQLIQLAEEPSIRVQARVEDQPGEVVRAAVRSGVVELDTRVTRRTHYEARLHGTAAQRIQLVHPRRPQGRLLPVPGTVVDSNQSLIPLTVDPSGPASLTVTEHLVVRSHLPLQDLPSQTLRRLVEQADLPQIEHEQAKRLAALLERYQRLRDMRSITANRNAALAALERQLDEAMGMVTLEVGEGARP